MESTGIISKLARGVLCLAVVVMLAATGGCRTVPKGSKFNVELAPGNDIKTASVEVDLIGANERIKNYLESYPIDKYWEPGDPGRRDADKYTIRLDDGNPKTLAIKDEIWDKWLSQGAVYLVVIAHLPGDFKGLARDPRREILSLDAGHWKGNKGQLQIEIQERLIKILTLEKTR